MAFLKYSSRLALSTVEKMRPLLFLIAFTVLNHTSGDDEINYYVKLIEAEIERSETYPVPNNSNRYRPFSDNYADFGIFDYIIVGSGSAGAIIASRLSEDPKKEVLLLEAGGFETKFTDIPAVVGYVRRLEYNWNYRTVPQKNACLRNPNQQCNYSRGKGLGGSTIINALIYSRGNEMEYNNWNKSGNHGWAFKDVLPFFQKLENYKFDGDVGYHGYKGPMSVEYTRQQSLKTLQFLNANRELGRCVGDYNGENQLCAGKIQFNIINGRRCSTGRAYLRPIWNSRSNLNISTYSYVTKVLINSTTKHAYAVIFAKDNKYFVARSRHEIILSAGIIGSPQILMLSGIGPKNHLAKLGIPVIQNLPVGKYFGDHVAYPWLYFKTNHSEEEPGLDDMVRDYLNGEGELTKATLTALVYVQTNFSTIKGYPDIEILFNRYINFTNLIFPTTDSSKLFSLVVALLNPNSQGYFKLRSSDPFDYPLINPNFFSDFGNIDMEKLYNGIQLAIQLTETNSFKKLGAQFIPVHLPECKDYDYFSKSYWYCHIRQLSREYLHPYGTCKMGPSPSMGAVVDSKLKVHGIRNLMVADGSVIPSSGTAHTNAPCMMIGEKAADMIRRG